MGYMHINNLYKDNSILTHDRIFVLEKIHGTSAHISWKNNKLHLYSGGAKYAEFEVLFNLKELEEKLLAKFKDINLVVFGEAYGGKMQKMSDTYGKELKFVVFDVKYEDKWLNVPEAESIAHYLGQEFVDYVEIPTSIISIDAERDKDSTQAIRNGMGPGKMREGVILRPIKEEMVKNDHRLIAKHKRAEFMETKTPREVDPDKLKVIAEANTIAEEWVVPNRLDHVLQKHPEFTEMKHTSDLIKAMVEDIYREAKGEIVESKQAMSAIGRKTAILWKKYLQNQLNNA